MEPGAAVKAFVSWLDYPHNWDMSGGDTMRNGAEPTAVRVLPAEGIHSLEPQVPLEPNKQGRRWPVLIAGLGVVFLFVVATRPTGVSDATPATTTTPPALAAVDTELLDLRSPRIGTATGEWETATFDGSSQIEEIVSFNSSMIALGSTSSGQAQAWLSSTGMAWRTVTRLELPETATSSLDHAALWNGDIVALGTAGGGVGLWTADTLSHWVYRGEVEAMGSNWPTALVAGSKLLAVSEIEGKLEGWTSSDGLDWAPTGQFRGLDEIRILAFAATEDWYFAGGVEKCGGRPCRPVIFRSRDAVAWEPTGGPLPEVLSIEQGQVVDIATTGEGLVAVGWLGPAPNTFLPEVAIWTSDDGASWSRVAEDEPLLQPTSVTIELTDLDTRGTPTANVLIDGEPHRLAQNSKVATEAGTLLVTGTGSPRVAIQMEGRSSFLVPGEPLTVHRGAVPSEVAMEGPRIVVSGFFTSNAPRAVIWSSADHGRTWDMAETGTAEAGEASAVALLRSRIVVAGSTESGGIVWASQWNTDAAEAAGVETLQAYIAAITDRDVAAFSALLPRNTEGAVTPEFQIPSLGGVDLPWWREDRAPLDVDAIGQTFEYLDALHTDMSISDCNTTMSLGAVDSLRVVCDLAVSSDLLAVMSPNNPPGRLVAILRNGSLDSVLLSPAPSEAAWRALATVAAGASDGDRATLISIDSGGRTSFDPTFTQDSAAVHLTLATEFVSSLLRPGGTKVVDTLFGTMEWQWLDTIPAPVHSFDWIIHTESGFVAIGRESFDDVGPQVSLWASPDGIDWVQTPSPEGIESMWQLQPFGSGFVAQGWRQSESVLLLFDGVEWTEVTFPPLEGGGDGGLSHMAVSRDRILVFTETWDHEGPGERQAWLVGTDLTPRRASTPDDALTDYGPLGLVGSDEGFVVTTSTGNRGDNISVWHSGDGTVWSQIAESASIDDARYVWNLQRHRSTYFVVGEGLETTCSTTLDSGEICQQSVGLWTSPDGVAWDRVVTKTGEPLAAYEVASGPMGLVAVGQESFDTTLPRSLYFSLDAVTWEHSTDLSLLHPDATWWWVNNPAVGSDTIIIAGASFNEQTSGFDSDEPFVIVGRVIDDQPGGEG
ncbi:MAG: hypothetical protein U9N84_02230 [Actinomycetota bacterium]|nr:hypothetical protein [Actinomycetota bacterium]